jgi:hypothetical protein
MEQKRKKTDNLLSWPGLIKRDFTGLAYQGKDIVFRIVIEYGSLRDSGP